MAMTIPVKYKETITKALFLAKKAAVKTAALMFYIIF